MIQVELNERLVDQQARAFARLMFKDADTRERIRKIIREEMKDTAARLREDAQYSLENDPRKAYRGVKSSVYRKILGGNVGILNPRRAGAPHAYEKVRKLDQTGPYQRGGNRRPRSARTEQIDSYYGKDRAFILRFISSGTKQRTTRFGNRGSITANHWFQDMAPHEIELAAENLAVVVNEELAEAYAKEIKN